MLCLPSFVIPTLQGKFCLKVLAEETHLPRISWAKRTLKGFAIPPINYRGLSGPSGPGSVPDNGGVRRSVPRGVPGPLGPRAPECPKSVLRVSPKCQKGVPDTLGTLSGHFLDTPEPPGDTPRDTLSDTPVFWDTLGDTPRDTRARGARETLVAGRRDRNERWAFNEAFAEILLTPTLLLPFLAVRHFSGEGVGMKSLRPLAAGILYTPLFITSGVHLWKPFLGHLSPTV